MLIQVVLVFFCWSVEIVSSWVFLILLTHKIWSYFLNGKVSGSCFALFVKSVANVFMPRFCALVSSPNPAKAIPGRASAPQALDSVAFDSDDMLACVMHLHRSPDRQNTNRLSLVFWISMTPMLSSDARKSNLSYCVPWTNSSSQTSLMPTMQL